MDSVFSSRDMSFDKIGAFCRANNLFSFEKEWFVDLDCPNVAKPAVKALLCAIEQEESLLSPLKEKYSIEKIFFVHVAGILSNFASQVKLSARTYSDEFVKGHCDKHPLFYNERITCEHLGMGVMGLWRGKADCRLRGMIGEHDVAILAKGMQPKSPCSSPESSPTTESDGATVVCEGKLKLTSGREYWPQLVKTCVVSAFIEHNLHPSLNPVVPTILLDHEQARIAMYNSLNDVLMISDEFKWQEGGKKFSMPGVFLL